MRRQCKFLVLAVGWAAGLSTGSGCSLLRCHYEPGQAVGLCNDCDPHSAHVYHHHHAPPCRAARRDPRIPGPKVVSTLSAEPEMATPGYFYPVPTYPVFGPRSEEPDGIEPQMAPLLEEDGSMIDGEPLPEPRRRDDLPQSDDMDDDIDIDDLSEPDEGTQASALELSPPGQAQNAGWKPARKQPAETEVATRPCATCGVNFKQPSGVRR